MKTNRAQAIPLPLDTCPSPFSGHLCSCPKSWDTDLPFPALGLVSSMRDHAGFSVCLASLAQRIFRHPFYATQLGSAAWIHHGVSAEANLGTAGSVCGQMKTLCECATRLCLWGPRGAAASGSEHTLGISTIPRNPHRPSS